MRVITRPTSSSVTLLIALVVVAMGCHGMVLRLLLAHSSLHGSLNPFDSRITSSIRNDEKPLLILHVGPSKTGTCTIQEYAAKHERLLRKDNFYFLGHSNWKHRLHQKSRTCIDACVKRESSCAVCEKEWSDFRKQLDYHYSQNHNIFVSEEMFDLWEKNPFVLKYLLPSLKPWRVRVLYTYRHCYEWLRSRYFENYEYYVLWDPVKNYLEWPEDGGSEIRSFWQHFESGQHICPSGKIIPYREHFDDVEIFNMHEQEGPLTARFFCEMIPEATRLCTHALSERKQSVSNPSSSKSPLMYFDQLVVAAYKKNLIDKSTRISRRRARLAAMHYANQRGLTAFDDFPRDCLDDEKRNRLLELSLKEEEAVVPAFHQSEKGETYIRHKIASGDTDAMFCFPNMDAFLDEGSASCLEWKDFFSKLGQSKGTIFLVFWDKLLQFFGF